jgi:hypothetical protein
LANKAASLLKEELGKAGCAACLPMVDDGHFDMASVGEIDEVLLSRIRSASQLWRNARTAAGLSSPDVSSIAAASSGTTQAEESQPKPAMPIDTTALPRPDSLLSTVELDSSPSVDALEPSPEPAIAADSLPDPDQVTPSSSASTVTLPLAPEIEAPQAFDEDSEFLHEHGQSWWSALGDVRNDPSWVP